MPLPIFLMNGLPRMSTDPNKQIDLISVSCRLVPYINKAYILSPTQSKGDHSTISIDFHFGCLISNADLSEVDPGHVENLNLVSRDIKVTTAFLKHNKQKNAAHNATTQMQKLFE
jgi:hypothetical protein